MSGTGSRKPADTPFKQQRLWAWQPILSPRYVIPCFFFIASIFIPIGAAVIWASDKVQEVELRYDDKFDCPWAPTEEEGGGQRCFATCTEEPCRDTSRGPDDCGQIGGLGVNCTRTFNKDTTSLPNGGLDLTRCDPKCSRRLVLEIRETMDAPVFLYYKLTNFYQNHRRYAKSRSDRQLAGESSTSDVSDCPPLKTPADLTSTDFCKEFPGDRECTQMEIVQCRQVEKGTGACLDEGPVQRTVGDLTYSPCGLVAWSQFNDTFRFFDPENNTICDGGSNEDTDKCKKSGIAWAADRDAKFKPPVMGPDVLTYKGFREEMQKCEQQGSCDVWVKNGTQALLPFLYNGWYAWEPYHKIPDPADEDFMVWMRTASLATFRKLYRRIDVTLPPGNYTVEIDHRFDVKSFSGKKYFLLTTLSWIGGRNYFLGGAYITIGVLCVLFAAVFVIKNMFFKTSRQEASYQNPR